VAITFRLRRTDVHGYDVEAVEPRDELFAYFVNADLLGVEGVEEMLEEARAIRAGTRAPLDEIRNVCSIELGREEVRIADEEWERTAQCTTDEFIAFLESILAELDKLRP
jgi:hypothetical protein